MNKKLMTTPYELPSLTLTTPLSIGSGGSGQSTASGTGLPVHQTSSTLNSPLLQSASITGALTLFGSNAITSQTGLNNLGSTQPSIVGSISPVLDNKLTITGDPNNDDSAQIYLEANANFPTAITFGQIPGSLGDGSSYKIGRLTGTAGQLQITSSLAAYAPLIIDSANGNFILNNVNTYIQSGSTSLVQFNSTAATFSIPIIVSGLTASDAVFTNSSKQLVSVGTTGSGSVVLSSAPFITTSLSLLGSPQISTQSGLGYTWSSFIGSANPTFQSSITLQGDLRSSNDATLSLTANSSSNQAILNFSENQYNTTYYIERVGRVNGGLLFGCTINNTNLILLDSLNNEITITYPTVTNTAHNAVFNTGTSSFPGAISTNGGQDLLQYSVGTFSPTIKRVNSSGVSDFTGISYTTQNGSYIKIGRQVTIFYEIECSFSGPGNDVSAGFRALALSSLPFTFSNINTSLSINFKQASSSFPNGIASPSDVPALLTPVFPYPYDIVFSESGATVDLKSWSAIGYTSQGTWTADGTTALMYCNGEVYGPVVDVPPYALLTSGYCQVYNFNILSSVPTYTGVSFSGSFIYTSAS